MKQDVESQPKVVVWLSEKLHTTCSVYHMYHFCWSSYCMGPRITDSESQLEDPRPLSASCNNSARNTKQSDILSHFQAPVSTVLQFW